VIVSDFPVLRAEFDAGAIHVANRADAVVDAVRRMQERRPDYRDGALRLKARKTARWAQGKAALLQSLRRRS
jgi:hypothetical protein